MTDRTATAMTVQRPGLSVREASAITGLSESAVRRWVDNWIAAQAGQQLPYPGGGLLEGRRMSTGRGRGRERRVDAAAARRLAVEQGLAGGQDGP